MAEKPLSKLIKEQLKQLPARPGVYLMKDSGGTILYVGKAISLRNRVRSYFGNYSKLTPKLQKLVDRVHELDFFVTATEQEALILENNLIKRHRPHYNVRLKDDKTYPLLKITTSEEFPRVVITRRMEEDGSTYFGPFANARSVKQTLQVLKRIFHFRSCAKELTGKETRPCLNYSINNCLGPCIGAISRKDYGKMIRQVILFLEGRHEKVVRELRRRMVQASEKMEYEKAALLRDQIQSIEHVISVQKSAVTVRGDQDVIAFATERDRACVQVFYIRGSKLIGRESFILQGTSSEEPGEILSSFIKQFYGSAPFIPPLMLLQHPVDDREAIEGWLQDRRGSRVRIQVPSRGKKKQLVDIVAENAAQGLRQLKIKQIASAPPLTEALAEIERELGLPRSPERMECYDISNTQGKASVGSMVVFENGKPKSSHYRRFKIKTVAGADDYASLKEVLGRRFKRFGESADDSWGIVPDLVVIDGGKGQLNAALSAMKEAGADSIPLASLAKENEDIFLPGRSRPVSLPETSAGLQLLQRLRDESHRFAIGYHRKLRSRSTFKSSLDDVPGIGPKRRQALLKQFGTVKAIREASEEELVTAKGMNRELAQKVKEFL